MRTLSLSMKTSRVFIYLAAGLLLMPFQNCSNLGFSAHKGSGTSADSTGDQATGHISQPGEPAGSHSGDTTGGTTGGTGTGTGTGTGGATGGTGTGGTTGGTIGTGTGGTTGTGTGTGTGGSGSGDVSVPHTNPNSCYTYLHTTTDNIRILFIVDQSGSNIGEDGSTPTDPNKTARGGSIQAFFNDYASKPGFTWGLTTFSQTFATPLIHDGAGQPTFTSSLSTMSSAINTFLSTADHGETPYEAALNSALTSLFYDTAPVGTRYVLVFLSDGLPNPAVSDDYLKGAITNLIATHPGLVSFNTIYYGRSDATASGRLQLMASVGKGYFLDTNQSPSAKDFLISNVVKVPGVSCTP